MIHTYDTIEVGDTRTYERHISQEDIRRFSEITGDDNPIHTDPEFAAKTKYKQPIAHGAFLIGLVSKILGHDFPGHGAIAVALSSRFIRPVPVDSTLRLELQVTEKIESRGHVKLRIYMYNEDNRLVCGNEAVLVPAEEPAEA